MEECNKEESQRAREIAEKKFNSRDLKGAKKFALKAEKLYPSPEISQLVSTLDVYLSSETRYGNDIDWYGVLGLAPFSDEDSVKKQYRKLALILHPDKNKSVGAEGAFQLISEAWSVLSDTASKAKYDKKRTNSSSATNNGVSSSKNKIKIKKNKSGSGSVAGSTIRTGVDTFWTSCNRCRMQYEYLRIYLNHNLLCPNCHNAFMAVETGYPSNGNNNSGLNYPTSKNNNSASYSNYENNNTNTNNTTSFQWETRETKTPTSKSSRRKHDETTYTYNYDNNYNYANNSANNYNFSYNSGGNANVHTSEKPTAKRPPGRPPKRRKFSYGETSYNTGTNTNTGTDTGINITERPVQESENLNGFAQGVNNNNNNNYGGNNMNNQNVSSRMPYKRNSFRDLSPMDIRAMLIEKAKNSIAKKLAEWQNSSSSKLKEAENDDENVMEEDSSNNGNDQNTDFTPTDSRKVVKVVRQPVSIDVPDPDFYDFDKDRTERAFDGDQVWATYDSEDGMPRLYAMVQKVLTKKPFTIRMSFLNSKSNSELGPINWVGSGFTKTCGDFRVGRYQVTDTVNIFSHRVQFEKGPRGIVKIIPRKGETWAVYKNWSPQWNELTPDDTIYKYEIVEIMNDYDAETGLVVVPLVKVAGFKAVFHRHMDPKEARQIPREEMFRFSHGIPSRLLTGEEAQNAPKGCHELDPAATPVALLQIINEAKEE